MQHRHPLQPWLKPAFNHESCKSRKGTMKREAVVREPKNLSAESPPLYISGAEDPLWSSFNTRCIADFATLVSLLGLMNIRGEILASYPWLIEPSCWRVPLMAERDIAKASKWTTTACLGQFCDAAVVGLVRNQPVGTCSEGG